MHSAGAAFTSHGKCAQLCGAKTNFLSQTGMCWIFFIQFYCAGSHTVGDALERRIMAGGLSVFIKPDGHFSFFLVISCGYQPSITPKKKRKHSFLHFYTIYSPWTGALSKFDPPSPSHPGVLYFHKAAVLGLYPTHQVNWPVTKHLSAQCRLDLKGGLCCFGCPNKI